MFEFIRSNYDWLFSGIGSGLIFGIIGYKQGYRKALSQKQKGGRESINFQSAKNININSPRGDEDA